ncbi:hypothetical protein FXV83_34615 [Bradyrhizobium hipponense]|uniref:Uncharacterized protein n=1 Tax=Bradyrhizobium hipponense TaxID=2605638 RepID=A0A5S4YCE9_9BRAD|nr:hypothetical protein FXV83_34615 [Bradyrhizobium hipponense]
MSEAISETDRCRISLRSCGPRAASTPSLRAQRSNPESLRGKILDCFAALAMTRLGLQARPTHAMPPPLKQTALIHRLAHALRCGLGLVRGALVLRWRALCGRAGPI